MLCLPLCHFLFRSFSPWLSMYFLITSIGAPPVVSRQKLWLQKCSFHSFCLICGNSFFRSLLLALLYAFIWVSLEKYMYMVFVMIPFFESDIVIWGNILKYLFRPAGNILIENLSAVFNYKHKMIV